MKSSVCVDASIIIRTLAPSPFSQNALALLSTWSEDKTPLIAPALLAFEVASVLRLYVYKNMLTVEEGKEALGKFMQQGVRLSNRRGIFPLAWELAQQFNRPRAYDTAYLALAQINRCEFWTADRELYNSVRSELSWVRWIEESS